MASREERARIALDVVEDDEALVWTMALNDAPLRRRFFADVMERDDETVVKLLARLANADVLAPTGGMTFRLAHRVADVLCERMPDEIRRDLTQRSLEILLALEETSGGREHPPALLLARHGVGMGRYPEAAQWALEAREAMEPADRGRDLVPTLDDLYGGLAAAGSDRLREEVGLALLEDGRKALKRRHWKEIQDDLDASDLDDEARQRFAHIVADVESARKAARVARKAAKVASEESNPSDAATPA